MSDDARYFEDNRKLWEAWTDIHTSGSFYDVESFVDGTRPIRVRDWEREEVGEVRGKTLLHLQCHFGLDTLSWARLEAKVTGLDFSPRALAFARELAGRIGVEARFVESNVYEANQALAGETFDIVYTSRGAIGWLPRIEPWAEVVARFLRPGGIFYIHEGHPVLFATADEQKGSNPVTFGFDYWEGDVISFPVEGSYADPTAKVDAEVEHGWNHGLGEIVSALASNGLRIEFLHEQRTIEWPVDWLVQREDGAYGFPPEQQGTFPLMFSLRARKEQPSPVV